MTSTGSSVTNYGRDYLERTIATVRNHREADNCWPQWANIFADEIERLWAALEQAEENLRREQEARTALREALEQVTRERDETLAKKQGLMEQLGRTEYRLGVLKGVGAPEGAAYTQADLDFFADNADDYAARAFKAEARLAAVPALVEALRYIAGYDIAGMDAHLRAEQVAQDALAAYEQAQK